MYYIYIYTVYMYVSPPTPADGRGSASEKRLQAAAIEACCKNKTQQARDKKQAPGPSFRGMGARLCDVSRAWQLHLKLISSRK
jgi:hypothetical protein